MKTRRGDVVLVLFPNFDLRTAKRRPALVIQRDDLNNGLPQIIVAMISSNLARRGHASYAPGVSVIHRNGQPQKHDSLGNECLVGVAENADRSIGRARA